MYKKHEIKYTMLNTLNRFFAENEEIVSSVEELDTIKDALKQLTAAIGYKEDQRINAKKGRTKAKASARLSMSLAALTISGSVFTFAKRTGNILLAAKSDIYLSTLNKTRDSELPIKLRSIKEMAEDNISSLGRYGVTRETLDDFEFRITAYENSIIGKDSSGALKSGASKSLTNLFKETDDILLLTDKMIDRFRETNLQFYTSYKSARRLIRTGVRHRKQ